jgi:hypothetical protein
MMLERGNKTDVARLKREGIRTGVRLEFAG